MRINKFIAENSAYSRRKADELIKSGKVFVNDQCVTELGLDIDPEKDLVKVNKESIKAKNDKVYIALYKPTGYVTTRSDELKRKTVMELVPKIKNLKPVGRLDMDTEGLLLLSNDGAFINLHTHPRFECKKEYIAKVHGELTPEEKQRLERGIALNKKRTARCKIEIISQTSKETFLKITIHEGRNRQIRKMFAYVKHDVKYLKRISIGKIRLNEMKKGTYRNLTKSEIDAQQLT